MGKTSGRSEDGAQTGFIGRRGFRYPEPQFLMRTFVAGGAAPSKADYPVPSVGDRFAKLTVTGYEMGVRGGLKAIVVSCACGSHEYCVTPGNLAKGFSKQCHNCSHAERKWDKHFISYANIVADKDQRTRLLGRIADCLQRCSNPRHPNYKYYGARGISVYEPWRKNRRAFLSYVITLEGWNNPLLDLDRAENEKGYEPGNLRFISHQRNSANRRTVTALQEALFARDKRIAELERDNTRLRHRLERSA